MNREIVSIIARFTCSISEPNENNDEGADEVVSEPKVKKPRGTPAKRKLPQSSNNMLKYVIPRAPQVACEHQQPQQQGEDSNGFNIKVNPNHEAKQNLFQ